MRADGSLHVRLVTGYFHPVFGGAGERFRRYAPGLRTRGVHLHVTTTYRDGLPGEHEVDGVPVERIPLNGAHLSQLVVCALKRASADPPDVMQIMVRVDRRMLFDLWRTKVPLNYTVTMVEAPSHQRALIPHLKQRAYYKAANRFFDSVIASTSTMRRWLIDEGFTAERITVIPNGVDVKRFRPAASDDERRALREQLGLPPNALMVLFVGVISHRKGVDLLLEAWARLEAHHPNAQLWLIGPQRELDHEEGGFHEHLKRITDHLTQPARVVRRDKVTNIEDYMRAVDVFVLPSRQEGMGNVVIEAMASGVPCVVTPFVGFPEDEFGQAGTHYLRAEFVAEHLAAQIDTLLRDAQTRQSIGRAARAHVEHALDVEHCLDKLADVYRTTARRRK